MRENFLHDILSQPSAPFRESHVIAAVLRELDSENVPYFQDPIGNIVVGTSSPKDYAKLIRENSREPLRFFIAHMDHPGFHGLEWTEVSPDAPMKVKWHGGSPTQHLVGAKVWLADKSGFLCEGEMT